MRTKVGRSQSRLKHPYDLLLTVLRRYFSCGSFCYMLCRVPLINGFLLTIMYVRLRYPLSQVKVTELPPFGERSADCAPTVLL